MSQVVTPETFDGIVRTGSKPELVTWLQTGEGERCGSAEIVFTTLANSPFSSSVIIVAELVGVDGV